MNARILFLIVFSMMLPVSAVSAKTCKTPTTVKQLGEAGLAGEKAFADIDLAGLLKVSTFAREEIVPCLSDALTTADASAFHRLMALEAFTHRNEMRVRREFHAARKLAPGYVLPEDFAGPDHPLRKLYIEAEMTDDGQRELVYPPIGGSVTVGGVRNAPRFKDSPVIVQVFDSTNKVLETRYVQPGETLPNWGLNNPMGITATDLGIDTVPLWKKEEPWLIASGVSAVIAAGFYGAAMYKKSQFNDKGTSDKDLRGLQSTVNGFGYTSIAATGVAIVLSGVAIYVHQAFGDNASKAESSITAPTRTQGSGYVER